MYSLFLPERENILSLFDKNTRNSVHFLFSSELIKAAKFVNCIKVSAVLIKNFWSNSENIKKLENIFLC